MTSAPVNDMSQAVEAALRAAQLTVRREGEAAWSGSFAGWPYPWNAAWRDDWFTFELRLAAPLGEELELLARAGSPLAGGAKFALSAAGSLALAGELRLPAEQLVAPVLHSLLDGVNSGLRAWALTTASRGTPVAPPPGRSRFAAFQGGTPPLSVEDLRLLSEEAGWPVKVRDAAVVADLAVADGYFQATLASEPHAVRVFTDVVSLTGLATESRRALALALLRLNGSVRAVSASFQGGGADESARLAVVLPARLEATQLGEALTALSATCRWVHRELAALADSRLAADYLAAAGFPLQHQPTAVNTNTPPP